MMAARFLIFVLACAMTSACAAQRGDRCQAAIDSQIAAELRDIDAGMQVYASAEERDWTPAQRDIVGRASDLMESHERAVNADDLAVLDRALAMLASESVWDRADDRVCEAGDTTFSLFCALQKASIDVLGAYAHRRTALQEVRFAVEEASAGRDYDHRLRDFNNDANTTLDDVRGVIGVARARVEQRLQDQQARCR